MKTKISSRERMLAALSCQEVDHLPCCFMMFKGLKAHCSNYYEFIERQIDLGLDVMVEIPVRQPVVINDAYNLHGLPVSYHPSVIVQESLSILPDEEYPIMVKEYRTPEGTLTTEVRKTPDWRWGSHVPFLDDYIIPRARKFLLNSTSDIPALRYLLNKPTEDEHKAYLQEVETTKSFAQDRGLLIAGGWGVGADLIGWVYGLDRMTYAVYDQPDFIQELLLVIAEWNQARMRTALSAGLDLFIKRAWYENCDFFTPRNWQKLILPILKREVELAHDMGTKFGYLITAKCMPLLEMIAEAGVDVIIGVDPVEWDLAQAKQRLSGRVALWGGVNGHLTVEMGSEDQVRSEVQAAISTLSPGGGFILSPVDNVLEYEGQVVRNVKVLIDTWRELVK